jgi:actin-like ATPase involved in cell morphogenesis
VTYHLGVDVGTTWTAAAVARDGRAEAATLGTRSVAVPTVVCVAGDGLLIGEPAARRAVTDPSRVAREFKRRLGDPTPLLLAGSPMSPELLMARVVEWAVGRVSETEGGPPASLAVTHPANWGEFKLDVLRQALRHVGVDVDRLVPEPVAAATAYAVARRPEPGTTIAVYDLGGGTFDAAVVRAGAGGFTVIGRPDGVERLGGIDFDHAVFRFVLDALDLDADRLADDPDPALATSLSQLREECVEAKEALSAETDVSIPVMLPSRHTEVRVTRSELEGMIRPALDETVVALRRALDSAQVAPPEVAAVLLVGGSSRIPLVAQLVGAALGRPIAVDARPKDAIALGAALAAMTAAMAPARRPLPPPPPPAAPASPPGPGGAPPGPPATPAAGPGSGATSGRRALYGALAGIAAAALVAAVVLGTRGGDDDAGGQEPGSTSAPATTSPPTTRRTGTTAPGTTAGDPGGDDPFIPSPLPGDDWSDAGRAQFLADCTSGVAPAMGISGSRADDVCGCMYDDISTSTGFAGFNEQWTSRDFDPSSPAGLAITSATMSCVAPG